MKTPAASSRHGCLKTHLSVFRQVQCLGDATRRLQVQVPLSRRLVYRPCTRPRNWPCDLRTQLRRRTKEGRASVRGYHAECCPCALAAWRGRPVKRALLLVSKSAFFRLSIIKRVTHMSAPQHTCGSASLRWYSQPRTECGLRSSKGTMYLRCRSVEMCPSFCLTLL